MSVTGPVLAVDIRNDHTALGVVDDGTVVEAWRVATVEGRTADEWAVLVRGLVAERWSEVTGVAVCAAVPSVLHEWRDMLVRHVADVPHLVVEPGVRTGIPVRTDQPREVGTDRVLNALAAATDVGAPVVVVDFGGTATTFDVVDDSGHYVGGAIAPGLELSLDALGHRGAQLRQVELAKPVRAIARNTGEALRSGMVLGTASQVDGLVARMVEELAVPREVRVVATGPFAPLVVDECRCFTDHVPHLTLRGLEIAFRRNR